MSYVAFLACEHSGQCVHSPNFAFHQRDDRPGHAHLDLRLYLQQLALMYGETNLIFPVIIVEDRQKQQN